MKRNDIITKLIAEGFTEKTLANMGDKQLSYLSKRILGEQSGVPTVNIPKEKVPEIQAAQKARKTFVTYEGEVKEGEVETKEAARTFANQNRKNMPQGTKFQAGRANKNKFKQEERAKVDSITKPFKTLKKSEVKETEEIDEKKGEKWIQKAIEKPGALKKSLGVGKDEKIPAGKLKAAAEKGGKMGKRANLAMTLKKLHEGDEVREWVEGLVKENYHTLTTKDEIMELIKVKLNEQAAEPGVAEPTTKPTTRPEKPAQEPGKGKPYPNPWEPPKPGQTPDPTPKFQDDSELPDFLETDAILAAIKGEEMDDEVASLTEMIMKELKK